MKRVRPITLAVLTALAAWPAAPASAQAPRITPGGIAVPPPQPTLSPYINLLRPGSPTFLNYYGLVRPQVEFRNTANTLQQEIAVNQAGIAGLEAAAAAPAMIPATGHGHVVLNTGHYF